MIFRCYSLLEPSAPCPANRVIGFLVNRRKRGFTLMEILVVMTIIGILTAVTAPALFSETSAGNMNRAVDGISLLLGQARSYAMANETYVWVGFNTDTASQSLTVSAVAGATGNVIDLASTSTYIPVWDLLIDVIGQSGQYAPTATNLNMVTVSGERHYWLHIAFDRYTGKVIADSLEPVEQ